AAATHFSVSASPASVTAGSSITVTVNALDQFNNTASGYSGTVHFTSSDGQAVLPANSSLTAGTGAFSATLKTAGSQPVTATDTVTGSIPGTSNAIAVRGLIVTAFTATSIGFTATFSKAFVNSSASPLNLYDAASASYGPPDVALVGPSGAVKGSLLI